MNNVTFENYVNTNKTFSALQQDAYAAMQQTLRPMVETLITKRNAKITCQNAIRRTRNSVACFLTANYAQLFVDYEVNLDRFFGRCDKTHDRFCKVVDQIFVHDTLTPTSESDQYRYTVNLIRNLLKAHQANMTGLQKTDMLASGSKRAVSSDLFTAASRLMCDSTTTRQIGIASMVLQDLGFCNATFNGNKLIGITLNTESVMFHKLLQMVIDGK